MTVLGSRFASNPPTDAEIRTYLDDVKRDIDRGGFQIIWGLESCAKMTQSWSVKEWTQFFVRGALHEYAYHGGNAYETNYAFEPFSYHSGAVTGRSQLDFVPPKIAFTYKNRGTALAQEGLVQAIAILSEYKEAGTIPAEMVKTVQENRNWVKHASSKREGNALRKQPLTGQGLADDYNAKDHADEPTLIKNALGLLESMQERFALIERVMPPVPEKTGRVRAKAGDKKGD